MSELIAAGFKVEKAVARDWRSCPLEAVKLLIERTSN